MLYTHNSHLDHTTALWSRSHFIPIFTDEETEAHGSRVTQHVRAWVQPGLPDFKAPALNLLIAPFPQRPSHRESRICLPPPFLGLPKGNLYHLRTAAGGSCHVMRGGGSVVLVTLWWADSVTTQFSSSTHAGDSVSRLICNRSGGVWHSQDVIWGLLKWWEQTGQK